MIKLGKSYFDETRISAITPATNLRESAASEDLFIVHMVNGHSFRCETDADEVWRTLKTLGVITPQSMSAQVFTASELGELARRLAEGFHYAAKDADDRVFAYDEPPNKGKRSWINDDDRSRIAGLSAGEYAALAFADEYPLDIAVALEGVLRC